MNKILNELKTLFLKKKQKTKLARYAKP